MTVPEGAEDTPYAELMICLPPTWKLSEADFQNEANYWPVRLLKYLARMPHEYLTWLAPGHTVPNGDPPEPFHESTEFCCALLANPMTTPPEFDMVEVAPGKVVRFMGVMPMYAEEVDFKLKRGSEELFKRYEKAGVSEVLKPGRKNVAKRSFWPF